LRKLLLYQPYIDLEALLIFPKLNNIDLEGLEMNVIDLLPLRSLPIESLTISDVRLQNLNSLAYLKTLVLRNIDFSKQVNFVRESIEDPESRKSKRARISVHEPDELEELSFLVKDMKTSNDVRLFPGLENLTKLTLYSCIVPYDNLIELKSLIYLEISWPKNKPEDLEFLGKLKRLAYLNLTFSEEVFVDLSPLKEVVNLSELKLAGIRVNSLNSIKKLINLKTFSFSGKGPEKGLSLHFLDKLINLEELSLFPEGKFFYNLDVRKLKKLRSFRVVVE
jgi:hypothetical protein